MKKWDQWENVTQFFELVATLDRDRDYAPRILDLIAKLRADPRFSAARVSSAYWNLVLSVPKGTSKVHICRSASEKLGVFLYGQVHSTLVEIEEVDKVIDKVYEYLQATKEQ